MFKLGSVNGSLKITPKGKLYLGTHLVERNGDESDFIYDKDAPFNYFHRLSSSNPENRHWNVDVDLPNRGGSTGNFTGRWRISLMNETDERNEWIAKKSFNLKNGYFPDLPVFKPISRHPDLLLSGTIKSLWPHVVLPEVGLMIANLW